MRITRSIIPNLFTLANLFSGFSAIILTSDGNFKEAAIFIIVAGIFDMLDGIMARLTRSTSELGVELDSLCDAVSFGVAPAFMLYKAGFYWIDTFGVLLASLPALAGVFRLARFNSELTNMEDKEYFTGMPIPAGALTIISYVVFYHVGPGSEFFSTFGIGDISKTILLSVVTVLVSLVMISRIKYENLPRPTKRSIVENPLKFLIFIIGILLAFVSQGLSIFPFMLLYICFGVVRYVIKLIKEKKHLR
ncbi:MAG: CDP-diacylglycerol--serine O-phosphatidyltransferase [Ignavibacteria bacterium]|nr:CDP-diacylglycerol--serine O-phosphatidyltransferase [Ignavibacteria bacterium]